MVDARLTKEVSHIVFKFYSPNRHTYDSNEYKLRLAASLYVEKVMGYRNFRNNFAHRSSSNVFDKVHDVLKIVFNYVDDLRLSLTEKNIDILLQNYTSVINYCLDYYRHTAKIGTFLKSQPKELTEFCNNLLSMNEGAKVYNPFGGSGSFAIENPGCIFEGEERDELTWAFLQIRLDANDNESVYKLGNSFDELERVCNSYDYVVCNPIFEKKEGKYSEFDIIKLSIENKLKDGGSLLIVLPLVFCYGVKYKPIREYLIDNGYLFSVISLPNIFSPITNAKYCLVLAVKTNLDNFMLVEGSKFITEEKFGTGVFAYEELEDALDIFEKVYKLIQSKEELDSNLDITPAKHVYRQPEIENPIKLGDLIRVYKGFYSDFYGWKCNFKDIEWSNPILKIEPNDSFISDKCLNLEGSCLITRIGRGNVKTGILKDFKKDFIALGDSDFAYQIKRKDLVLEAYLRLILESDIVLEQVNAYSQGTVVSRLSEEDFLNITIPLPDLKEQERIVNDKLDKIYQQAGVTNTYADLAHMLGTPFSKISAALAVIESNPNLSTVDQNAVKSINANLGYVTRLLDMNMGVSSLGENQEPICLYDFVIGYLDNWKLYGAQTFNVEVLCDDLAKKLIVKGNKDALTIMFDCLLDNANRHGFHKKRNPQNKVVINIQVAHLSTDSLVPDEEGGAKKQLSLLLKVGNNGTPMPDNFGKSDYITKGRFDASSGRTGLGGYHVYSVVKSMDGDIVDIIKTSGWTEFLFIIPVCINN